MTDRFDALIVVLEKDTREDDAEYIINAIQMIKGVRLVKPQLADYTMGYGQGARVRLDVASRLQDVIDDILKF